MRNPRHILITGASSGIGAALAAAYAAPGIRLSLHGRNLGRLEAIADLTTKKGASVSTKAGDVAYATGLKEWIEECDRQQPIDLVIANAGISGGSLPGMAESESQTEAIFSINVTGVLNTVQPCIPLMMQRRKGQIAIISSLAGFRGFPSAPAYCASKAAVRVYGEGLRAELSRYGVEVNVVCPGFIKTAMTEVNKFPMPMIMSAERAAEIILNGLARNKARIAFPLPMYLVVRALSALPLDWTAKMITRMPRKPPKS